MIDGIQDQCGVHDIIYIYIYMYIDLLFHEPNGKKGGWGEGGGTVCMCVRMHAWMDG